ncbi:type II CAAX prenyl endopeptidase Rce1 family protein [Agrobacterium sp. NPDC058088]|uniref:CPBP family glutamic-type intramembrane protease n=1 Tax=Agrobacterium sp. NPDC058088 TaxID=3346335 RepID=UPI0036D8C101
MVLLWTAIIMAAVLFAAGHVPILFAIISRPQPLLIIAILLANFIPGLLFGWLFWRRELDAAMFSHAFAHCVNELISKNGKGEPDRHPPRLHHAVSPEVAVIAACNHPRCGSHHPRRYRRRSGFR